jgi:hypothetical protein
MPSTYSIPSYFYASVDEEVSYPTPTLRDPQCQMPTHSQFREPMYARLCEAMAFPPSNIHRKDWEWVYIARCIELFGLNKPGKSAVCFASGAEPLVSFVAAGGANVLATDAPEDIGGNWGSSGQYATKSADLFKSRLLSSKVFDELVSFRPVDMNHIPEDVQNFDFLWSSCALEHLGTRQLGIDFVHRAMRCLKPGGIAIHTTELNLGSNEETIDSFPTCFFLKRDIERLAAELVTKKHWVAPLNFHTGREIFDRHIDQQPYSNIHLKAKFGDIISTSFGIIIKKGEM